MSFSQRWYARLTDDAGADPLSVTGEVPANFLRLLASSLSSKLGDALANPKTTLAWLVSTLGMPPLVLALLVPLREAGSMLPQVLIGGFVRRQARRKWVWVAAAGAQAIAVAGLAVVAATLSGQTAGVVTLLLLAAFSIARAFASLAAKDVIGKTLPVDKRGQLTGLAAAGAGLATVGVAAALLTLRAAAPGPVALAAFLAAAAALWLLAAGLYATVREAPSPVEDVGAGRATSRLALLASDPPFRRFVIARALLLGSALSAPFYIALAQRELGGALWVLGAFVGVTGLAGLVSGPIWGRLADRSARLVMAAGGALSALAGVATVAGYVLGRNSISGEAWFLPATFFVLAVAHAGIRVGRKTYVVNLASGPRRTDYVAAGNSVIGLTLLIAGGLGFVTPAIGETGVLLILAGMTLLGSLASLILRRA